MKKVKQHSKKLFLAFLLLIGAMSSLEGQQLQFSMSQIFRPWLINPARAGSVLHNNVFIAHQQRKVLVGGWRSVSQFVNYNSQPLGRSGRFGWGINLNNDIEHTENRFNFTGSVSVRLIETKKSSLSVGFMAGLINWSSNYNNILIYDRNDELLLGAQNFLELDAGPGIDYSITTKKIKLDLQGMTFQLPGNFLSSQINGVRVNPHAVLAGKFLFTPIHNIFVGPMAFYRNIIMRNDTNIVTGTTDVGLKLELERQGIWAGGAYRVNRAALTAAFGMQIHASDTANSIDKSGLFVDLNAGFSLPVSESSVFGPSVEIGLDINFGRPYRNEDFSDTLRIIDGAFWKNDGNLNRHTDDFIKPNGPGGLRSTTYVTPRSVQLTYSFLDQSLQYVGTTPLFQGDSLLEVGVEWIGVDGLAEGICEFVIKDALNPDSASVMNIDSLEALKSMVSLDLSASLQANEEEVSQLADGMIYEGEFGTNNPDEDTLFLKIIYNEVDTTIGIALNRYINNLELAALKLHSIRKKMEYELDKRYGESMFFQREGDELDSKSLFGKKLVRINQLRITPNHPNQDAFQVNHVEVKFNRFEKVKVDSEGNVIPDDLPGRKRRKRRKKQQTGRRDKR